MNQFILTHIKWFSSMEEIRKNPKYHKLLIDFLNETEDLEVDEDSDLYGDDFYANDVRVIEWIWKDKSMTEIIAFPGDTEIGGVFIDNKLYTEIYGDEVSSENGNFDEMYSHMRKLDGSCTIHDSCIQSFKVRQNKYPVKE